MRSRMAKEMTMNCILSVAASFYQVGNRIETELYHNWIDYLPMVVRAGFIPVLFVENNK